MATTHINYSVSNEYWLKDKPHLDEVLDMVTLPIRTSLGGQIVDLRGKRAVVLPGTVEFLKDLEPRLAAVMHRIFQVAAFIFSAYFWHYAVLASGMMLLKHFSESSQITRRIEEIGLRGFLRTKLSLSLDTTGLSMPDYLHLHKKVVYEKLQRSCHSIEDKEICLNIYPFDRTTIKDQKVFSKKMTKLFWQKGRFNYPPSTDYTQHWTVNFSCSELFAACADEHLTQSGLQIMEHPGLYHVKSNIEESRREMRELQDDEIALISGLKRYGIFIANRLTRKNFTLRSTKHVETCTLPFSQPKESHLFCMVAPRIPLSEKGKPYQKETLEALFYRSYHAFMRIKTHACAQKVEVHTGNWGCSSSGHSARAVSLMQIAAGHLAGIDIMNCYPLTEKSQWLIAAQFYQGLCRSHPSWSVDKFLTDIASRADALGLKYRSDRD